METSLEKHLPCQGQIQHDEHEFGPVPESGAPRFKEDLLRRCLSLATLGFSINTSEPQRE